MRPGLVDGVLGDEARNVPRRDDERRFTSASFDVLIPWDHREDGADDAAERGVACPDVDAAHQTAVVVRCFR